MNKAMEAVSIARRNLVLDHPFFGVLSLKLEVIEDGSVKTLCTDGRKLKFNPDYVESLSSHELVGAMAHEVLHCANGHTWRRGHRDAKVWNHACDYAINPIVLDAGMVLPKGVLDGSPYKGMPAEEIYERISQQSGQGGEGEGQQADGCGEVVDCGVDQLPEIQAEWLAAVLNAARQASAMGRLPAGMERVVEEIKNPPQDWRAILRRFVQANARNDYSWQSPNPRYLHAGLFLPALRSETMPPLVVAVDTSGSIDEVILGQFRDEIEAIVGEMTPEKLHVVYCDNQVQKVEVFEAGEPVTMNPAGFGGTDFRPVFDWVENEGLQPACLVYLTDMCGSFPLGAPDYPVLWGDTLGYGCAPFGETVRIRP